MILQMILFESYVLLERLDQLSFLRNYAYLYFQRESFSNSEWDSDTTSESRRDFLLFWLLAIVFHNRTQMRKGHFKTFFMSFNNVLWIVRYVFFTYTDWVNTDCVWMCKKYELCRMTLAKNRVHQGSDSCRFFVWMINSEWISTCLSFL